MWLAVLAAIALGVIVGLVNGLFITVFRIHSLIVTLGTGTFLHGVTLWISGSMTISGLDPSLIQYVIVDRLFGIPLEFYYALALCIALWYVLEHTAVGRRILFVGRGREVARLSGIDTDRTRMGCLVASSLLGAVGGVLYAGTQGAADPSSGASFLLPAFAAAFLGSTSVVPGRFNPWGALVAVYFLVTGHHRAGVPGCQLVRPGHVLRRRSGARRHSVAVRPRPRGAAILGARRPCWHAMARGIWSATAAIRRMGRPGDSRLAVNFVLNVEEGSEYSIGNSDGFSEATLTEMGDSPVPKGERDLAAESMYEYGSRVGVWRVLRLFAERDLPITLFGCAMAFERHPEFAAAIREAGYDVCCHGWRWVEHYRLTEETEREHIKRAVASLQETVGRRPLGWYCR